MADCTFQWLRTGDDAFAEMLRAIDAAQQSVRLETYIFAPGALAQQFRSALLRARERGINVRVLVDALGSYNLSNSFWTPLEQAGGLFRWFNPLHYRRISFRDHRKLLVCDDHVALIGGLNIAPEYQGNGVTAGWRDLGLKLFGNLARELAAAFDDLFARADFQHPLFTRLRRSRSRRAIPIQGGELLLSGPGRGRNPIEQALLADLERPRRVQVIAAYFLPTGHLRRALTRAVRRGATAQLILPSKSDVPFSRLASRSLYERLLRAGVEIYEYQPQILHTKLVLVDDVCYAGSANLDARSLRINYELMVRLDHTELVEGARDIFKDHLLHSHKIDRRSWRASRGFWARLKERWACFILARLDLMLMRRQLPLLTRRRSSDDR